MTSSLNDLRRRKWMYLNNEGTDSEANKDMMEMTTRSSKIVNALSLTRLNRFRE